MLQIGHYLSLQSRAAADLLLTTACAVRKHFQELDACVRSIEHLMKIGVGCILFTDVNVA